MTIDREDHLTGQLTFPSSLSQTSSTFLQFIIVSAGYSCSAVAYPTPMFWHVKILLGLCSFAGPYTVWSKGTAHNFDSIVIIIYICDHPGRKQPRIRKQVFEIWAFTVRGAISPTKTNKKEEFFHLYRRKWTKINFKHYFSIVCANVTV